MTIMKLRRAHHIKESGERNKFGERTEARSKKKLKSKLRKEKKGVITKVED